MKKSSRQETLNRLAQAIGRVDLPHPVRAGIDGFSCSGKTRLADELAEVLRAEGREVLRAGLDGFHNPPEIRHRKGPMSVEGYLEYSFDYQAVREKVLSPLGPGGNGQYLEEIYDHRRGEAKQAKTLRAPNESILLFEGVMLFRPELRKLFDFRILIDCSPEVILERAKARDLDHFGNMDLLLDKYLKRFIPGQERHLKQNRPAESAHALLFNDDPQVPILELRQPSKS